MIPGPCTTLTKEPRNEDDMARRNRTGTTLTAREIRRTYPGLEPGFFGIAPDDEDVYGHDEIVAPEYTGRPCGCVTTACPECRPLWFDADGNFTGQTPLWPFNTL